MPGEIRIIDGVEWETCTFEQAEGVYHAREGRVMGLPEYQEDFTHDCVLPVRAPDLPEVEDLHHPQFHI